jgi:hypothetical protein
MTLFPEQAASIFFPLKGVACLIGIAGPFELKLVGADASAASEEKSPTMVRKKNPLNA